MSAQSLAVAGLALLSLTGCGKTVGRVPFTGEGTASSAVALKAGNVAFWTDLDLSYTGPTKLSYTIELEQSGVNVATAVCDPLGPMPLKLGWVEVQRYASYSVRGNGKMSCAAVVPKGGPTTVRATLAFDTKPSAFTVTRADLVLRQ